MGDLLMVADPHRLRVLLGDSELATEHWWNERTDTGEVT